MSSIVPKTEVFINQEVRRVEVTLHEAGGGVHETRVGSHASAVPWSTLFNVPSNLCLATLTEDQTSIEFRNLAGQLITKVPYIP